MSDSWQLRTPHHDLVICRRRDVSAQDLRKAEPALVAVAALNLRSDAVPRRTLMQMCEGLFGWPSMRAWRRDDEERARRIIEDSLRCGALVALRIERRRVIAPIATLAPLGPAPEHDATPNDWIQVMLFDSAGRPMPTDLDPIDAAFDVDLTSGRKIMGIALMNGFGREGAIEPGGPSSCSVTFPKIAEGLDFVPTEAAHAREPELDASLVRGPLLGPVRVTRSELARTQGAALNATNAYQLRRRRAEVFELEHFNEDGAVFLPGDCPASLRWGARVQGIDALKACLLRAKDHPLERMLVVGHDATLSVDRAKSVLHLLTGDREAWRMLSTRNGTVKDYNHVLQWAAAHFGWPCDPGPIANRHEATTKHALEAFQRSYNRDSHGRIAVDGVVGKETWGAIFDTYARAIRKVSDTAGSAHGYIIVDASHQTYPVKLAETAAPCRDARRWTDLNPLNPEKVIPSGGGWLAPQIGERIYIPDDWSLEELAAVGYEVHRAEPSSSSADEGPSVLAAPGPKVYGCGAHHLVTPFANAEERRAVRRHVEVIFFEEAPPTRLCDAETPDPCRSAVCELYDPREYTLAYLPCDGRPAERWWVIRLLEDSVAPVDERRPLAHTPYEVRTAGGASQPIRGSTDARGVLRILVRQERCDMVLRIAGAEIALKAGDLRYLHEGDRAVEQRLANLGYFADSSEDNGFEKALRRFQCAHGIADTGTICDATRAGAKRLHGG